MKNTYNKFVTNIKIRKAKKIYINKKKLLFINLKKSNESQNILSNLNDIEDYFNKYFYLKYSTTSEEIREISKLLDKQNPNNKKNLKIKLINLIEKFNNLYEEAKKEVKFIRNVRFKYNLGDREGGLIEIFEEKYNNRKKNINKLISKYLQ